MKKKAFFLLALIVLSLGCWVVVTLVWGAVGPSELIVFVILGWLLLVPLTLAARSVSYIVWVCAGLLILVVWFLPVPTFVKLFPIQDGDPLGTPQAFTLLVIFSLALVVVALLLNAGLRLYKRWQNTNGEENSDSVAQRKQAGRAAAALFFLGALLLARALYNFYWFMIWDTTGDGLGYLWLPIPILVVLSCAFILFLILPEKGKLPAFLFLLLIPAMIAITAWTQGVDFRQLTEDRASRVNQAIEAYYAQEGHYPRNLRQLTPRYALAIPGPVIIYGQEWCYEGGEDYYRLGYINREHWSAPHFIGRIVQTKGQIPTLYGMCEQEAIALQKRHPDYPYKYWVEGE